MPEPNLSTMPIDVAELTAAEIAVVLATEEGHFGDLKAIEVAPAKLTRSLAAFANADGGDLWIGVDEDKATNARSWRGFNTPEDANGHIQALEATFPLD